ncbi:hypothetical protein D9H39_19190 [Escherichia coli]|uniref:hypothetical protein n=1 Tax=Escherichia coli TaxID=562 RepID=UPI00182ED0FD|nr:hypothetical protein [Escherichia coli]EEW1714229.1 hypothetical protein [Escherichia coli]EEW2201528.1 hypothetical protein [Escherichia coli]EFC1971226.1 hypothetical protein [Escherichia coli]EFF9317507.1 hypothetical protein [Escherichia coli]EFN5583133.1 hypothetical protein [Escherichia coli]
MTVHTLKQCRPDQEETEYFWKLFHAAQRNDARWHGSEISIIADELSRTDLDRNQKLFLLRAWQVLVDDKGGFGRLMGAFDTYVYNMQDPDDDCVAWKPELAKLLQDGNLFDVVLTAYQEACHEGIVNWEAAVSLSEENVELKRKLYAAENQIAELEARTFNPAILDVIAERQRQKAVEGWTSEHDDAYQNSELADAAACYAINAHNQGLSTPAHWPWAPDWWKQSGPRRDLVKAGALILAEIERIDRQEAAQ